MTHLPLALSPEVRTYCWALPTRGVVVKSTGDGAAIVYEPPELDEEGNLADGDWFVDGVQMRAAFGGSIEARRVIVEMEPEMTDEGFVVVMTDWRPTGCGWVRIGKGAAA